MTRKTEVSIAILILLVLIAVLLFLFRRTESVTTNTPAKTNVEVVTETPTDTAAPAVAVPTQPATPTTMSRIFVERFGSYSTDVDYANVTDVLPLVTDRLSAELQDIAEEARKTADDGYYGVSTNVIKITTDTQTDTTMTLMVKTQREEAFGSPGNTSVRYQDIRVEFVKIGDEWFVERFEWL